MRPGSVHSGSHGVSSVVSTGNVGEDATVSEGSVHEAVHEFSVAEKSKLAWPFAFAASASSKVKTEVGRIEGIGVRGTNDGKATNRCAY